MRVTSHWLKLNLHRWSQQNFRKLGSYLLSPVTLLSWLLLGWSWEERSYWAHDRKLCICIFWCYSFRLGAASYVYYRVVVSSKRPSQWIGMYQYYNKNPQQGRREAARGPYRWVWRCHRSQGCWKSFWTGPLFSWIALSYAVVERCSVGRKFMRMPMDPQAYNPSKTLWDWIPVPLSQCWLVLSWCGSM